MKIKLASVFVNDQDRALEFYTAKLGFTKKHEIPLGEAKWLTVVSPEGHDDVELLLEPNAHPASKAFQKAIYDDGIPATAFASSDVRGEYEQLLGKGVRFITEPTDVGPTTVAVFDDECGNLIQIFQA